MKTWENIKNINKPEQYHFETDVCAVPENAKCEHYFTPEQDGLSQEWTGVCWMNPPYGRGISLWVRKACESAKGNGAKIVCLLPARTDTAWWHDYIKPFASSIDFIRGRIKFGGGKERCAVPECCSCI